MADGVRLAADVWRPASGGPWPTLLQRLPYGRSVASSIVLPHPNWLARRGYVVVVQDVRGTGESGGEFVPFVNEAQDGAASVEWAAGLPYSNGVVGMYGFSYQGLCQLSAAAERPPSLRAIAPLMCSADPYEGWTYEGGCLRWEFAATWSTQLQGIASPAQEVRVPNLEAVPIAGALGPSPPPWFREWLDHPLDDGYWAARRPVLEAIDVPAMTIAGWFDDFSAATVRLAARLEAEAVFGPWAHIPWGTRLGVELGDDASPRHAYNALVDFFDRHLKGAGAPARDRIRYFVGGAGWRAASSWPPSDRVRRFVASSDGNANSRHGDGRLLPVPAELGPPDVIVSEPGAPYPATRALQSLAAAEDRRDVLCYTSDPMPAVLDIAGSGSVYVRVRCDRETFDLVASLVMVDASVEPRALAYGALRLEAPAGSEVAGTIELRPVAWRLPRCGRLRLDLSPSLFPAIGRNPHTTVRAADLDRSDYHVATIEVLEARLTLPID